jgi:2-polyprenyl-3-methyl-5-hydroxy-6-metoxy-1,4-benzoquinol methylase
MNPHDREVSNQRYRERLERYGANIRALASGVPERRAIRFDVLAAIGDLNGCSVLDLGCGLADFYEYLCRKGLCLKYTGYDISPDLIHLASVRFPDAAFEVRDIQQDGIPSEFDYIVSSQVFNARLQREDNFEMAKDVLRRMFAKARKGVVCDFLTSYVDFAKTTSSIIRLKRSCGTVKH